MEANQASFSMTETLNEYIDENEPEDGTDYKASVLKIVTAGHEEVLETIRETFFQRLDHKKRLVWLYGSRNTGKSTLIRYLEQIFVSQKFNFKGAYCPIEPKTSN